ncbi:MAG: Fe-S cluster assembly protein SufD [Gemmatimonadota bacterium]|nr:Fe-S cluster assembly protein SufD [Gemmatimonadota bacterium]
MSEGTLTRGPATAAAEREEAGLEAWVTSADEPALIAERRRAAWTEYRSLPMPTRRSEEWRYTDISGLDPDAFAPVRSGGRRVRAADDLPAEVAALLRGESRRSAVLVQHDGVVEHARLDPELAERGVRFAPLAEVAAERPELLEKYLFRSDVAECERKLWALHVAALSSGYVLHVPKNVAIPHPVHVVHYLERPGALVSTHTLILAEAGSEVACIDEYVSPDLAEPSLSLNGVEIFGSDNATVRYLALQRYGRGVRHFSMQHANTGRDARLSGLNVSLGADLARCDVSSHLQGPGSESEMLAVWFGDGTQHFDHHTLQNHVAPHARSDLLFKGALTGEARSVFRGLIRVAKGAQLTDAYQTNRNLLLSDEAEATTLPNLEIEADDVRCSHGATVGQVDAAQLFYLMSRGLSRSEAEHLLVLGFFDEVLNRVPLEGLRERIREAIDAKLAQAR